VVRKEANVEALKRLVSNTSNIIGLDAAWSADYVKIIMNWMSVDVIDSVCFQNFDGLT
jgi:hypothetical protein